MFCTEIRNVFCMKIVKSVVGIQAVSEHYWLWILAEAPGHLQLKLVRDHIGVSPQHDATYDDDINQICWRILFHSDGMYNRKKTRVSSS